jgi:uncharacterized protein YdaU (DUF1376 family)
MTKPIWMPFYVADYLADTQHLSTIQHGAYMLMLMSAWTRGGSLPADDVHLAGITRLGPALWRKHKAVLMSFFDEQDGSLVQKRLSEEYLKSSKFKEAAQVNGAKGGRPKNNPGVKFGLTQNEPKTNPTPNPNESKPQPQLQPQETKTSQNMSPPNGGDVNGFAVDLIPVCPQKEIIALYHEHLPLCPHVREWNDTRQKYLKTRWREKAIERHWTSKAQGLEMFAKLFDFIAESKFLTGQAAPKPGQPPFMADLEWIVRPNNWAKIIEGRYHHD